MLSTLRHARPLTLASGIVALALFGACGKEKTETKQEQPKVVQQATPTPPPKPVGPDPQKLQTQAKALFGSPLPDKIENVANPSTQEKVNLGRMLYFDTRLSKNHDLSCNSCHSLTDYGVDVRDPEGQRQVSKGHKGQLGDRNSPTVYNAALQFRQFWDGRAADVEEQAKGPVLNPVEMAMKDEKAVVAVLKSIPGYVAAFKAAFPDDKDPVTYENMAKAIGAFERGLLTPAPFDQFLGGKLEALDEQQLRGLATFMGGGGCTACHLGPGLGGSIYQKLGLMKAYESKDLGRFKLTQNPADMHMFKVPLLRNIEKTAPYLHDGSLATLEQVVDMMAEYQTQAGKLKKQDVEDVVAFLKSLTGELPKEYIAQPELPPSGPKTAKPDPS